MPTPLLLTFYGDDFTGSTDTLEALTLGGLRAALFLEPPRPEQLQGRFADLQALGVAGASRSMPPEAMEIELRPKFAALKQLGAPLFHYKVCSTFDSSPEVGSIGRAIDLGWEIFEPEFVPLVVGAPTLKRYVVFGNLFATVEAETFRLDRHPTMSQHPITPMNESDLRLHLGRQTQKSIALLDILHLAEPEEKLARRFEALLREKAEIVLFDTLDQTHLNKVGQLIWQRRSDRPLFIAGSSGLEYALTGHWQQIGLVTPPEPLPLPGAVTQLIVISGSAAPGTASQIGWALKNGFQGVRLNTAKLIDPDQSESERAVAVQQALAALGTGSSVVIYAARGPDDPALQVTRQRAEAMGLAANQVGPVLARQQGQILQTLLAETGLRRVCVAGGDTSSHTAPQLGIYALEMVQPIAPGAPLCRASSAQAKFDGLEICLKGGQNGQVQFFGQIRAGRA